ncbi:uncharacterized protein [Setaria viridis]|uniref:uncharacterized protein isoform X3 n=1 Tax=Setaria viridis TaxID=4556 RepID=UPI00149377B0|nr:uncharacterized protein LOC117857514 isoform X4 [Setaria viridis]
MQGGALFEFDGNFVGMNIFWNMERPIFLPRDIIFDRLNNLWTSMEKILFPEMVKLARKRRTGVELRSHPEGSMNVDTFEEYFGDKYPTGVWGEFKKEIYSNISDRVVAPASFHDKSKFFACTGIFIDSDGCSIILTSVSLVRDPDGANEIVSSLRVLLPNNERTAGKLEHYSLQYNVALVSVKNYNVDGRGKLLEPEVIRWNETVVAVGRCFESGLLMAASGKFIQPDEVLDDANCDLWCSTCKTTKVVIGGPLIDLDGNFVGINYYDTETGTRSCFFLKSGKFWKECWMICRQKRRQLVVIRPVWDLTSNHHSLQIIEGKVRHK